MDKRVLLLASVLVAALSVLPAVALIFNRASIAQLSEFLAYGTGTFADVLPDIVAYGALLALIAVSGRMNSEYLSALMENTYAYGMQAHLMDVVSRHDIITLMRRNVNEDFNYIMRRSMALNQMIACLISMVGKAFSIASLCVAAATLSPAVLFIVAAYVLLAVLLSAHFSHGTRFSWPVFRKAEVKAQFLQSMPQESNVAKEIRLFGCADEVVSGWERAYDVRMRLAVRRSAEAEKRTFLASLLFYAFLAVAIASLLGALAAGDATPATLLTTFSLCTSLFTAVGPITRDLMSLDENMFAIEQQSDLLDGFDGAPTETTRTATREGRAGEGAAPDDASARDVASARDAAGNAGTKAAAIPVFEARGVTFSYTGAKNDLDGVDLVIMPGEVVALVGENGSGKSTLAKVLLGTLPTDSGELSFCGVPYENLADGALSKRIGAFFQDFYLYHHSVAENIAYGCVDQVDDREAVRRALRRGGAERIIDRLPQGLDTMVRKRIDPNGVEFSGGEKQLLGTSRAYMGDKDVLIFDEPASMLDPLAELDQFARIRSHTRGRTAILISHRVGFARLADRIVVMDRGRVAETGTHDELLRKGGLYAQLFRDQAQFYLDDDGTSSVTRKVSEEMMR
ncbi:ABC transporter ATP-binding protein [Adlercreutzia sp. ZJ242]|uniref:ABC transporter ATP-binding protein n=1 Tax=Adlercreutzia sp. ZJ242 TaxID=2709409 RepID=UPI0013EBA041|nr:ABC transporter ATP-binding protein [Adlercreutzia sp. ZJ242]